MTLKKENNLSKNWLNWLLNFLGHKHFPSAVLRQKNWVNLKIFFQNECIIQSVLQLTANLLRVLMFGGAYGDARMPNWPHRHHTPLPGIATSGLHRDKGRMLWGRQPFCPHFSSATWVCGWCDYTLPLFRILWLGGKLAARCLQSRPAWIVFFCFRCWVADGKNGRGEWRGLALDAGWRRLWATSAALALSSSCGTLSEWQKRPPGPIHLHFSA